ncbi:MAG: sugar phosphate isomerase/epimerase family protein [Verrucomicrobiota bacterium]|nr:sugar phosphate isomerase/epimerase family protein [Verrucomicrobiota bacterium]
MIKSSVTIALVPEAKGGPFVYWDDLPNSCAKAAELGFDGVEVFPRSAESVDKNQFQDLLSQHNLQFAAMGTGAGMVVHGLSLTNPDINIRKKATDFIKSIIDFAGPLEAPAIIGSMQGRHGDGTSKEKAIDWLSAGLNELGAYANQYKTPLLYEPLNRYETNLFNTIDDTAKYLSTLESENIKILADLFHMNIEEQCIHQAIQNSGNKIGHVHFVDSNRRAAGFGHMNHEPISHALNEIGFDQFVSAEAFPIPNSDEAAKSTINSFNKYFR